MSDRGKWNPTACSCSWENTVRGGRLCHYCAAIRQAQQGSPYTDDQLRGLLNQAQQNVYAELQSSRRDQELAGMQAFGEKLNQTIQDVGDTVLKEIQQSQQEQSDWASVYEKHHNTFNYTRTWWLNEKARDLPMNWKNLEDVGEVVQQICNSKPETKKTAGAVWRFFNRWKLRVKYCCSLPWRGAKWAARRVWYKEVFATWGFQRQHPHLFQHLRDLENDGNSIVSGWVGIPRWRLWFRDDSNGKAKHKLNDERLWI